MVLFSKRTASTVSTFATTLTIVTMIPATTRAPLAAGLVIATIDDATAHDVPAVVEIVAAATARCLEVVPEQIVLLLLRFRLDA